MINKVKEFFRNRAAIKNAKPLASFPINKGQPDEIPLTKDNRGFLNFGWNVRVLVGKKEILNQPLILILNQHMKDYGYHPEKYQEIDMSVVLRLPTGSEASFPFATKRQQKAV
jgi:hypothetical protein